jgi:4-hydroxybenzoate polyprenyltransferase/phosphoglycolate phosphatase-like HAD superfamily hydrolase
MSKIGSTTDVLPDDPPLRAEAVVVDVLFVDLDGTLIASDLLWESLLLTIKLDPRSVVRLPGWFAQGKAALKQELAVRCRPDAAGLPYREEVLVLLREAKEQGVSLVLATGSNRKLAHEVAEHLGLFDDILASDGQNNLIGARKLEAILGYCHERGHESWGYFGDSETDVPIWKHAHESVAVNPSRKTLDKLGEHAPKVKRVSAGKSKLKALVKALRPHQWAKNVLLFAPLVLAHTLAVGPIVTALLAFIAFSLCASSVYVLNDLLDIESDRKHPTKRNRPFASGRLSVPNGPVLAGSLLVAGVGLAVAALPWEFVGALGLYLVLTSLYSFWLKRKLIVDVLLLAGLYTLRIIAGGLATGTAVSEWLMAFSVFLFTSLAFAKRHAELTRLAQEGGDKTAGRGYQVQDTNIIASLGPTSGYLAVLVFALYINNGAARGLYAHPWALWLVCPLLLYWVTRVWFIANRGRLSEDPVVFAMKDGISRWVGVIAAALVGLAAVPW